MNFNNVQRKFTLDDIDAIGGIIDIVKQFKDKILIDKREFNLSLKDKIPKLKQLYMLNQEESFKKYEKILKKLEKVLKKDLKCPIFHISGAHGGFIINDVGFCEFDSPVYALDQLINIMTLYYENGVPYNIEVAISALEWLEINYPKKFQRFLEIFEKGKFEIINPTYSQPYTLLIGPESNIKQFEYGLKILQKFNIKSEIFYSSESAYHPQIPQILSGFDIKFASLRTRLKGLNPSSFSANINWIGVDNTIINTIVEQSGIFSGEYYHGMYFKQLPDMLFQAVTKPFMPYILYSCIEDFIMPLPYREDLLSVSKFSDLFGKFISCTEFFNLTEVNGEHKYRRDDFLIDDSLFLPSDLHLQIKNSEVGLITAEIINSILSKFDVESADSFLEDLWRRFLLTQSHDCFAVPFIRSGDYIRSQLDREKYSDIELKTDDISLINYCIEIHNKLQNDVNQFIDRSLRNIIENSGIKDESTNDSDYSLIVFNPTAYSRQDIVSVHIGSDFEGFNSLICSEESSEFHYEGSKIKFITKIPGFGYKIYNFDTLSSKVKQEKPRFLFKADILDDLRTISIRFKNEIIFELNFSSQFDYKLKLEVKNKNNIEQRKLISGTIENDQFSLEIVQYHNINRLEFFLESNKLDSIDITPKIEVKKTFINYPFGIEETFRSSIHSLDFLWLTNESRGIFYIQKNSPKFKIDRANFGVKNLIIPKGKFEFSISITDGNDIPLLKKYVDLYHFKLKGVAVNNKFESFEEQKPLLSITPPFSLINLWRRENNTYIRVFNPSNDAFKFSIKGILYNGTLTETNLKSSEIETLKSNQIVINPWKIKTIKF